MDKNNDTNLNQKDKDNQVSPSQSPKASTGFFNYIFKRSKTDDNPGFINRQIPAYWYDGKS